MSDPIGNAPQASMQSLVLQPIPYNIHTPLPKENTFSSLTYEQKLAYAAYNLEQHEDKMKDEIRKTAICEKEYATPDAQPASLFWYPTREPDPNATKHHLRHRWKPTNPKPTVRTSKKTPPPIGMQEPNSHLGIAKRMLANLDGYDEHFQPTLEEVQQALEVANNRRQSLVKPTVTPVSNVGDNPSAKRKREEEHYDRSRDPRVRR